MQTVICMKGFGTEVKHMDKDVIHMELQVVRNTQEAGLQISNMDKEQKSGVMVQYFWEVFFKDKNMEGVISLGLMVVVTLVSFIETK